MYPDNELNPDDAVLYLICVMFTGNAVKFIYVFKYTERGKGKKKFFLITINWWSEM